MTPSAVRRCMARLDHHCAWLNNCVGFNNMRYFLLFLAANVLLTAYGAFLATPCGPESGFTGRLPAHGSLALRCLHTQAYAGTPLLLPGTFYQKHHGSIPKLSTRT